MSDLPNKGRTVPFTVADRAALAEVERRYPGAGRRRVCELFERTTGRAISVATLDRMRRKVEPGPDVAELPAAVGPRWRHALPDALRDVLLAVLAEHPSASLEQARRIFAQRTGRRIVRSTVRYFRTRGVASPDLRATGYRLNDAQRGLLLELAREAAPGYCRREIAEAFSAATGRPLTEKAVSDFLVKTLGLPRVPRGTYARRPDPARLAPVIEAASRRKLAAAPRDCSVRPGRTSRVIA